MRLTLRKSSGLPANRRRGHGARGFSLIELVIAMVIMGIIASIAAPRFSGALARYRLDSAARRIAGDLNMARDAARTSSQSRKVAFKVATAFYQIDGVRSMRDGTMTYTVDLTDEPYGATLDSVDFGGDQDLFYNGFGAPDSSGKVVVRVGAATKTIMVDGSSGKATVQ